MKTETTAAIIHRLAVILKDSNDAITVQDLQGNIMVWNSGAEKMYGYTETEALQMNIAQIIPLDNKRASLEYLARIASGEMIESFETQRISKNGKILDIWLVITCLKDDSGNDHEMIPFLAVLLKNSALNGGSTNVREWSRPCAETEADSTFPRFPSPLPQYIPASLFKTSFQTSPLGTPVQ